MEAVSNNSGNEREVLIQTLGELEQRYSTLKKEYDSLLSQQDFERGILFYLMLQKYENILLFAH